LFLTIPVLVAVLVSVTACDSTPDKIGFRSYIKETGNICFCCINTDGSNLTELIQTKIIRGTDQRRCWAADAGLLVYLEPFSLDTPTWICAVDADGQNRRRLYEIKDMSVENVSISPDGSKILFLSNTKSIEDGQAEYFSDLMSIDVESGEIRQITDTPNVGELYACYSCDGGQIAFLTRSNDSLHHCTLYIMRADGGTPYKVADLLEPDDIPSELYWAPDGKKILMSAITDIWFGDYSYADIISVDILTGAVTNLTHTQITSEGGLYISPDSSKIIYLSHTEGSTTKTCIMDIDGSNKVELSELIPQPCWLPDSKTILFSRKGTMCTMDTSNNRVRELFEISDYYSGASSLVLMKTGR